MTRIEAVIRPSRLDEGKTALNDAGVNSMSVVEMRGAGKQKGYTQHHRGSEYQINLLTKLLVIAVVPDSLTETAIAAIEAAAKTGEIVDGNIFVSHVDDAMRIRTGERGDAATFHRKSANSRTNCSGRPLLVPNCLVSARRSTSALWSKKWMRAG